MKCPNCDHEQADGWLSCQKCHIIFSRWYQGQGQEIQMEVPPPTEYSTSAFKRIKQPKPERKTSSALIALVFMALAGLVLWWLFTPSGLPVLADAYIDRENGFAFNPPEEWESVTEVRDIMDRFGGVFPPNIRNLLQVRDTVVGFVKPMRPLILSPSVNVVVSHDPAPALDEKSKAKAAENIGKEMAKFMTDYKQEALDVVVVDRLRALRIVYSGFVNFNPDSRGRNNAESTEGVVTHPLRFQQVFIPNGDGAFILTFSAIVEQFEDLAYKFRQVLDSFRVLNRPLRFSPPIQYGLAGLLVFILLILLSSLFRALSGRS